MRLFLKVSLHVQGEGSAACVDRPLCSKKDYFQIHTACDQEGKVRKRRPPENENLPGRLRSVFAVFPSIMLHLPVFSDAGHV